jgi:DNA repair photolyase
MIATGDSMADDHRRTIRGRGTGANPTSRSVIATNASPDVGFDKSVNPYRGCEHGCVYCYARPTHEYLGFSAGLDFETKIVVKQDAPRLLKNELSAKKWKPQPVALSGNTDPYQPAEKHFRLSRQCLEVLAAFRNPVIVITKNHLVTRDIDILSGLARHQAAAVFVSITTLDHKLTHIMEPRTARPERRLSAITALSNAGIPTGVLVAPMIPGLTDHEIPAIVEAATDAGASYAGYILVRLPHGVAPLFEQWLADHLPDHRDKVLRRIRALRGGRLSDPRFGSRQRGSGVFADQMANMFKLACKKAGILGRRPALSTSAFRGPSESQQSLFD